MMLISNGFSCQVVGTVVGGKVPTKIKTDLKKPIVNLACHPRLPVLVRISTGMLLKLQILLLISLRVCQIVPMLSRC